MQQIERCTRKQGCTLRAFHDGDCRQSPPVGIPVGQLPPRQPTITIRQDLDRAAKLVPESGVEDSLIRDYVAQVQAEVNRLVERCMAVQLVSGDKTKGILVRFLPDEYSFRDDHSGTASRTIEVTLSDEVPYGTVAIKWEG